MTTGFGAHFCGFMQAWKDGRLRKVRCEDLTFDLDGLDDRQVACVYCIINDLDDDRIDDLLAAWAAAPPPRVPANIVLGEQ